MKPYVRPWGSRRLFLAGAAAAGLWPALAWAQRITADTAPLVPAPDQESAALAARNDANRHLTIEVRVNGKGPYHFVVDTGAERSVISDEVAAALALPPAGHITIRGIAAAVVVPTVHAAEVSFGPFVRDDILMPILPRSTLAADGYLGLDVIDGTRVTFDFKDHLVRIEQPKPQYAPPDNPGLEARISAPGKAGRLQILDCLVDGVAAVAFVDSGAEVSVANSVLLEELKKTRRHATPLGTATLTGVTGGELQAVIFSVARIKLQDLSFTDGALEIADVPDFDDWNLKTRPALLIGMDYMRQFARVSVDYRAKEIRFEISLAPPPSPRPGVEIHALG